MVSIEILNFFTLKLYQVCILQTDIVMLDNPHAFMKWMVSSPYVAGLLSNFNEDEDSESNEHYHHEDTKSFEKSFRNDIKSFIEILNEVRNTFLEPKEYIILNI